MAPTAHPMLIVLDGPDAGREIRLDALPVAAGRGSTCAVRLTDLTVSREHVRLAGGGEGVVLTVLSGAGVRIGGKRFRKGRQLVLGGGDVFQLGGTTTILFVDAGDDPVAALAAVRQDAAAADEAEPADEGEPPVDETPQDAPAAPAEAAQVADGTAKRPSSRKRRIAIGLGIYFAVLALAAVALSIWSSDRRRVAAARPSALDREQIVQFLKREPADVEPNSVEAARVLDEARQRFAGRHLNDGDAYRCVRLYLRYKALSGRASFETIDDQHKFDTVLQDLLDRLWPAYEKACLDLRQGRYHAAQAGFEQVRALIPIENDPINRSAQHHLKYILDQAQTKKRGYRGFGR